MLKWLWTNMYSRWYVWVFILLIWLTAAIQVFMFFDSRRVHEETMAGMRADHLEFLVNTRLAGEHNYQVIGVTALNGKKGAMLGKGCTESAVTEKGTVKLTCHFIDAITHEVVPETNTIEYRQAIIFAEWTGSKYRVVHEVTQEDLEQYFSSWEYNSP